MTSSSYSLEIVTPLGGMVLEGTDVELTGLRLAASNRPLQSTHCQCPAVLWEAARQLEEYFSQERTEFELPIRLDGTTFQRQVWAALVQIPYGQTVTYGELAGALGLPKGPRAVGQANARNPIPIIVPCHRVVAHNGLGGYAGGLVMKQQLLEIERGYSVGVE